jgi:predicted alpha/beta hydrolase
MTASTITAEGVAEEAVTFRTKDGFLLSGKWFVNSRPSSSPTTALVVSCGAGIPARYYYGFARYLATRGAAVFTYDYRGIGDSRHDRMRGLVAGIEHWAAFDFSAALAQAHAAYPSLPLAVAAHSVGTLFVGAAADIAKVSKIVFFGAHTGYWRDYGRKWRWVLFLGWHVLMPVISKTCGYFPGSLLHLGEDLPLQVALDWAGRRQPEIIKTSEDQKRFGPILSRFAQVRATALAISISDDAFAPPYATRRLLSLYPNVTCTYETITPSALGRTRLGHFGFLRRSSGGFFWRRAADWLMSDPGDTGKDERS